MRDYSSCSDSELFELLSMGKKEAFEIIYERHFVQLINKAFKRLGSKEDAREIVQEVFVQLYMKRTQIAHTDNLAGYLHTLLRNKIIDFYREQLAIKKKQYSLQQVHPVRVDEMPGAIMDGRLLEKKISNLIDALPQKCREVFLLSRNEDLSHYAISKKLNISVSTVEKHVGKALKVMRRHF